MEGRARNSLAKDGIDTMVLLNSMEKYQKKIFGKILSNIGRKASGIFRLLRENSDADILKRNRCRLLHSFGRFLFNGGYAEQFPDRTVARQSGHETIDAEDPGGGADEAAGRIEEVIDEGENESEDPE
jgi:hypothetical protein